MIVSKIWGYKNIDTKKELSKEDNFSNLLSSFKVIAKTADGADVFSLYNPPVPSSAGLRLFNNIISRNQFNITIPTTATLAVTNKCQLKCIHCSNKMFQDKNELTTGDIKSVIDETIDLGVVNIVFTGGEPLLRNDIFDLISYVDRSKAITIMFTNGVLLSDCNVLKLIDAGLYAINISIDSPYENIHDKLRGLKGSFRSALNGARKCREAGLLTGLSTYATSKNINDGSLERILEMAQRENLHETTIFDCIPAGKFLRRGDKILSSKEREYIINLANRYNKDHPMGVIAQSWINSEGQWGCFGGNYQFHMTAYGDITPCDFNPLAFGNIRNEPLKIIWEKITSHEEFKNKKTSCRMQHPEYRKKYIDT